MYIQSSGPSAPAVCGQFAPFQAAVAACQNVPPHYSGDYYFAFFTYNRSDIPALIRPAGPDQLHEAFCVFYQRHYTDGVLQAEIPTYDGAGLTCPGNSHADTYSQSCTCWPSQTWMPSLNKCVSVIDGGGAGNPPPGGSPGGCSGNPPAGNPIYPMLGSKREQLDLGISLAGIPLRLTYDTADKAASIQGVDGPKPARPGAFGELWDSTLHRRLLLQSGSKSARVSRGDGTTITFAGNGSNIYTAPPGSTERLTLATTEYRLFDPRAGTIESFDFYRKLTRITGRDGRYVAMTYSTSSTPVSVAPAPDYLIQATDESGRTVSFTYIVLPGTDYSLDARVASVVDVAGQRTDLGYDTAGRLVTVKWPDAKIRTFLYERADLPWAMTGVQDERLIRYATFGYDPAGRAVSTEYAGGVNKFSVSYTTPPALSYSESYDPNSLILTRRYDWAPPAGTVLTGPTGSSAAMSATTINGKTYRTSQSQPAGSGCSASTQYVSYDTGGNLASSDDFNGNRTCYANDAARNLETARVEGLAASVTCSGPLAVGASLPPGARKITTQWHPDWQLRVRQAEPGKLTTWVYNGQPDPLNGNATASCAPATALLPDGKPIVVLCKQVEQATTDADGRSAFAAALQGGVPNRQRSWTYDAFGRILTEKGPRTDVNETTTYTYFPTTTVDHTVGDVDRITNPAGQVTAFTNYNKYGQPLRSVAPSGVVTVNTYDARQRLATTTVGTEQTVYTYDAAGLLKQVTMPDTTKNVYTYDNAQRLVKVVDEAGNSITYTLDNAGNRIREDVKDSSGALKRTVTRTFDALGRVQQQVGAPQ